ncbi:MAG TPA: hypothetical protein VMV72_09540 [Verrucomicrobiae bacterium]|nr:hypothetical protein [Verrucomicrobiae bacterium]
MEIIALILAVISLVLSGVAYWRAGGRRDIDLIHAKHQQLVEALLQKIDDGHRGGGNTIAYQNL